MLRWNHPNPLLRLEGSARRIHGTLSALLSGVYGPSGISSLEGNVLAVVASASPALTVPQVARILGVSRQAVQGAVRQLKSAELLKTAKNPHHKRSSLLNRTDKGTEILQSASKSADKILQPVLAQLDFDKVDRQASELFGLLNEIEAAVLEVESDAD